MTDILHVNPYGTHFLKVTQGKIKSIPDSRIMLVKRQFQGKYPSAKKYKGAYIPRSVRGLGPFTSRKQFGAGYNPKAVSNRLPPPGAERKFLDSGQSVHAWTPATTSFPTYYAITTLNNVSQGDQITQRNSNKIIITDLDFRMTFSNEPCAVAPAAYNTIDSSQTFRLLLLIDTQANGAAPPLGSIFDIFLTNASELNIFNNVRIAGRFKTLWDKFVTVNTGGVTTLSTGELYKASAQRHIKKHFKLNLPVQFGGSTSNLADVVNNNIFFIVMNNTSAGTYSLSPWRSRIRFTDY